MAEEKKNEAKKLIEPMRTYDKSKLVNPMEAVNKQTAHPPQSRDAFFAEMRAKYHMSDQETASQTPGISKERFESFVGIPARDAVQQTSARPQAAVAGQSVTADAAPDITLAELPVGRKEGPTPLDLVKKMINCCAMVVKDGELYTYRQGLYRQLDQKEAEAEIWSYCRKEVEQTGSKSILTGAYQMLLVHPDLRAARLLSADNIIPFRNGLLRLDDGAFLPHSPAYFVTYVLQCDYSPYSVCPIFDRFLHEITGGDAVLTERIWEFIGVCLTREDIKKIFVLQGRANSGKSVLINTMNSLIPAHVRSAQDVQGLDKTFAMKEYKDKLFCVSSDMSGKPLSTDVIGNLKKLSGRDILNSDVKYGNHVEFRFTGHVAMVTNHPLMLKMADYAFWTRLVAIPFFIEIPEENRDPGLEKKLQAELPGIAYKAMNAFFNLRRKNYRFAGEYPVNSPQLFSDSVPVADTATLVFLFLQKYFECGSEEDLVVVEEAADLFNRAYGLEMSPIHFSAAFCQHAAQMYHVEKVRSRAGGYKNARSCLKGLRYINN